MGNMTTQFERICMVSQQIQECVIHFCSSLPIPISISTRIPCSVVCRGEDDAESVIAVPSSDIE